MTATNEWHQGPHTISTENDRLDIPLVHNFLANSSYWARGRTLETVRRSIENSLSFGVYKDNEQIGFARVVTDYATFAWIADVFIVEEYRGTGVGKWLIDVILSHPGLQGFRRWVLATK